MWLVRVLTKYWVGGIELSDDHKVQRVAPIIAKHLNAAGWDWKRFKDYCRDKGWEVETPIKVENYEETKSTL